MQEIKLTKGVAMMIRAILNIEPERLEQQINDAFAQCTTLVEKGMPLLGGLDDRLQALEASNKALQEDNRKLISLLERLTHDDRSIRIKDCAATGTRSIASGNGTTAELSGNSREP